MLAHKAARAINQEAEAPHFYLWLNNEAREGIGSVLNITSPYDGRLVGTVSIAGRKQIREAIASSHLGHASLKSMPRYKRSDLLVRVVELLKDSRTELVDAIILEGGKPRIFAEQEFERAVSTFTWAAEEAKRFVGEQVPMDGMAQGQGYEGYTRREAIGTVFAITPFNFPLNLVAHKVAPALACGNAVILKPASNTPITALILGRVISEAGFPPGSLNVLPMRHQDIPLLLQSDEIHMLSFTGSPDVGWVLKQMAGRQRVSLELGGNAGVYIDNDADIDKTAKKLAMGGFAHAGQSCISVQRIFAHQDIYPQLLECLIAETMKIKSGNPQGKDIIVGPVITHETAQRILALIDQAVSQGAVIECGGGLAAPDRKQVIEPTLISHVKDSMHICSKELFGPVITLTTVENCEEAIRRINDSKYGLQAALFSNHVRNIQYAIEHLNVGGVVVNDVPTFRVDHMPYGGTKLSGLGREGIRSAMLEMTEEKMVVTRLSS